MIQSGFLMLLVLQLAAPAPVQEQARRPYVIQQKDKPDLFGFWEQRQPQDRGRVRVELDTPWNPGAEFLIEKDVVATPERRQATEQRIRKGWEAAGYVLINGNTPVPAHKYELAMRARKMAGLDRPQDAPEHIESPVEPTAAAVVATDPAGAPQLPGFFAQWGAHIGLLLVSVLLTGLILRMTFLASD